MGTTSSRAWRTSSFPFFFDDENSAGASDLAYYIAGNWVDGSGSSCEGGALENPWEQCENDLHRDESFRAPSEFDFTSESASYRRVTTSSAADAYAAVLAGAGAFPRDAVSLRSAEETSSGTGAWGAREPADLMAGLTPAQPPTDEDDDGMADSWELEQGLDPEDGEDHQTPMPSGYPAIEEYLNELAAALIAP